LPARDDQNQEDRIEFSMGVCQMNRDLPYVQVDEAEDADYAWGA